MQGPPRKRKTLRGRALLRKSKDIVRSGQQSHEKLQVHWRSRGCSTLICLCITCSCTCIQGVGRGTRGRGHDSSLRVREQVDERLQDRDEALQLELRLPLLHPALLHGDRVLHQLHRPAGRHPGQDRSAHHRLSPANYHLWRHSGFDEYFLLRFITANNWPSAREISFSQSIFCLCSHDQSNDYFFCH